MITTHLIFAIVDEVRQKIQSAITETFEDEIFNQNVNADFFRSEEIINRYRFDYDMCVNICSLAEDDVYMKIFSENTHIISSRYNYIGHSSNLKEAVIEKSVEFIRDEVKAIMPLEKILEDFIDSFEESKKVMKILT